MIPMQFGPISRIPVARQMPTSSSCSCAPSSLASAKPAEMITSARTPFCAHSRATASTALAGVTIKARSTGPGQSRTEG